MDLTPFLNKDKFENGTRSRANRAAFLAEELK
jgi:hypothetical protein